MAYRRKAAALALLLACGTALTPLPGFAGTVQTVDAAAFALPVVPGSEPGIMRNWVQLVWNPVSNRLERIAYSAWDPIPSLGLDLEWIPADPANTEGGLIDGDGTLRYRTPGAASYDPSGTVAEYVGELVNGVPSGAGVYTDSHGFSYDGTWRDGLMDGEGRLSLANGDQYVGSFAAGAWQGNGVLIDSTGAIYQGGFARGQRDGQGVFMPTTGDAFTANWSDGIELPGTRRLLPAGELPYPRIIAAQDSGVDGLRIGIVAERRPHNYALGIDPLSYTSVSDGQLLTILPDDQRLLDVWHGNVPVTMTPDEILAFDDPSTTPSFLGRRERFEPLSLVFELENSTTDTISLAGGFINVAESRRNSEPAVQVRPIPRDPCSGVIEFMPRFFIDNFGWASADNVVLNLTAGSVDGRSEGTPIKINLAPITDSAMADVSEPLAALGLDADLLSTTRLTCTDPNDERLCLGELRSSGHFGALADFIGLDYTTVTAAVSGTLDYDWTGSDGAVHHKSSPFSVTLPVATVANDAECGEGGEIVPVMHDPFMLDLDASNYRIAIPFRGDVEAGFTARWRIELQAPETSEHDFQLLLVLADGRQIASRPVHLTYFTPPERDVLR